MLSIDRIEENIAVCFDENESRVEIDIKNLPLEVKEGDWLKNIDGQYIIDKEYTLQRRKKIQNLQKKLWE